MGRAAAPVSIGLPVYNGARYLPEALASIRGQTFADFELLICDNASTDATADLVVDAAADDERIRVWRSPNNIGAAANYNRAFSLATGRYFKWASHDDRIAPTFLERCLDEFEGIAALPPSGTPLALVYPRTTLIDEEGTTIRLFDDRLDLRQDDRNARLRAFAANWRMGNALMGLIRSDLLGRTGRIRPYPASDLVLLAELAFLGSFHELDEPLFERRIHDDSATQGSRPRDELDAWYSASSPGRSRVPPLIRFAMGTNAALLSNRSTPLGARLSGAASFTSAWAAKRTRVRMGRLRKRLRRSQAVAS